MPPDERQAVHEARQEARTAREVLAFGVLALALMTVLAAGLDHGGAWALVGACAAVVVASFRDWWAAARAARELAGCERCRLAAIASCEALTDWDGHVAAAHWRRWPRPWTRKGGDRRG